MKELLRPSTGMTASSSSSAVAGPPEEDEVEVSIFGPGKGECIAVHLGAGDWMIVDSCIDQATGRQPALDYLQSINVDLSAQVKVVLATHAHDDHIAGISAVYEAAENSVLILSSASTSEEFFAAVEADAEIEKLLRKSVRAEYRRLLEIAEQRGRARANWPPLKRAVEGLELWSRRSGGDVPLAWVRSLSPSHHAVTRAQAALATGAAVAGSRRRLAGSDPNEFAVALWVQIGDAAVLLGADLLRGPAACGWEAVLATFAPPVPASYFKVPHHGAPNAHHPGVWSGLLGNAPTATLAPYRAGVTRRPADSDIGRLQQLTPHIYSTANPRQLAPSKPVRRARVALARVATDVHDAWGISGHVRTRASLSEPQWRTEVFHPAVHL